MARNTGGGFHRGSVDDRTQVLNPTTGIWTKRNTATGRVIQGRGGTGRTVKGVAKE
jgi:hypothetical protein